MTQCTYGTQPKAGSPTWVWLLWSSFLAWLTTHYARFGNIVWVFFPDAPLNIADFCAAEVDVPSPPALLTWVKAFTYDAVSQIEVGQYLVALYKAAFWDTYCECVLAPGPIIGPDNYETHLLALSPEFYWPYDDPITTPGQAPIHARDASPHGRQGNVQFGGSGGTAGNWLLSGPFAGWYATTMVVNAALSTWNTTLSPKTINFWMENSSGQLTFFQISGSGTGGTGGWLLGHNAGGCASTTYQLYEDGVTFGCNAAATGATDGAWHMLTVVTPSAGNYTLYKDGAPFATWAIGAPNAVGGTPQVWEFGNYGTSPDSNKTFARPSGWDRALSAAEVLALYRAAPVSQPGPIFQPPTPVDPTAIPDRTDPTCSTTADLCAAVARLEAIQLTTQREVNWLQSSQSPTGWSPGTTATGLTGAGTIAATDIVGLFVDISIPSRWGRTAETPYRSIPEVGSVGYSINGVQSGRYGLHYAQEQIFGAPPATTAFVYNLRPGVSASITPLVRLK